MKNHDTEGLKAVINPALSDRLYTLSAEYSVSVDSLVNSAVERLIDDVEFFRELRAKKIVIE